jgi:ectoine hydroxylase-related dioxygenase (phytanoyl-CoA dioxygenase family)
MGCVARAPTPASRAVNFSIRLMDDIKIKVEKCGFAVLQQCISRGTHESLAGAINADEHGARNLLANAVVRSFACSDALRKPVVSVLGQSCFAVRGIFFNKNSNANWKVTWHQDCVIAVREKVEIEGWGPWSRKAGVTHVRPPAPIVQQMLAIRIHLDDCGQDNGPLRVIPGTHIGGFLSDRQIQDWPKDAAVTCAVSRGDAILLRPLLLHASSTASQPSNRRVIHLEFAAHELPNGATWHDRVP